MSQMTTILLALVACAILSNLVLFYFTLSPGRHGESPSTSPNIAFSNISLIEVPQNYLKFVEMLRTTSNTGGEKHFLVMMTPLLGLTKERLAVRTWILLQQYMEPECELLVLGLMERPNNKDPQLLEFDGLSPIDHNRFTYIDVQHCINSLFNIPEMDCLIHTGMQFTNNFFQHFNIKGKVLYMFVNSDIVFSPNLPYTFKSLVSSYGDSFAAFGQRTDVNKNHLVTTTPQELISSANSVSKIYGKHDSHPYAIDYFIFPEALFPKNFPKYLVGVYRWDNHLALELILSSSHKTPVIDSTTSIPCLHEGVFNTETAYHKKRVGADYSDKLVHERIGRGYFLGRTSNVPYRTDGDCSSKGCKVNIIAQKRYERSSMASFKYNISHFKTGEIGIEALINMDSISRIIVVLAVSELSMDFALNWVCHANKINFKNYMFYARDKISFDTLSDVNANVQIVDIYEHKFGGKIAASSQRGSADALYFDDLFLNEVIANLIKFNLHVIRMSSRAILFDKNIFEYLKVNNCSSSSSMSVNVDGALYSYGMSSFGYLAINDYIIKEISKRYIKTLSQMHADGKGEASSMPSFNKDYLAVAAIDKKVIDNIYEGESKKHHLKLNHCRLSSDFMITDKDFDNRKSLSNQSTVLLTSPFYSSSDTSSSLLKWNSNKKKCML